MHCQRQNGRLKCGKHFLKNRVLLQNGLVWTLGGLASKNELYQKVAPSFPYIHVKFHGTRWLKTDLSHLNRRGGRVQIRSYQGQNDPQLVRGPRWVVSQVMASDCHVFKKTEIDCQDMKLLD